MIVAILALVMATVGTGYAALKLPKNSVGTKQLKKNSVTGAKVKKGTLTGKNINLAKLGTVPSATTATTAGTASALTPPEAVHLVGTAGQPPFLGGSTNIPLPLGGANLSKVGYWKDHDGVVHLQGIAQAGKGVAVSNLVPVFQLPPGYRPTTNTVLLFAGGSSSLGSLVAGGATSIEGVNIEGDVLGAEEEPVILDGVTFRAET